MHKVHVGGYRNMYMYVNRVVPSTMPCFVFCFFVSFSSCNTGNGLEMILSNNYACIIFVATSRVDGPSYPEEGQG